jgi:hypothetical protein
VHQTDDFFDFGIQPIQQVDLTSVQPFPERLDSNSGCTATANHPRRPSTCVLADSRKVLQKGFPGADAVGVGADVPSALTLVQKHDDGVDGVDDVGFLSQRADFGHGDLVWQCHGSADVAGGI